jgi:hypothetical protein
VSFSRTTTTLAACLWAALAPAPARAGAGAAGAHLEYAEPLAAEWEPLPRAAAAGGGAGSRGTLRFRSFGRDFAISLAPSGGIPAGRGFEPLAGRVSGEPGSWARITRRGSDLIGLVHVDGAWYAIEPAESLRLLLDPDAPALGDGNAIYRLDDLRLEAAGLACGVAGDGSTLPDAAAALAGLDRELAALEAEGALGPARRVQIAPVADVEFANRYGTRAESEIAARLNIVDGIFSSQVGVDVAAGPPEVYRSTGGSYPFDSDGASGLLGQISDYRLANHAGYGLTHLFTGKSLGSGLVGIAWRGAVCFDREGAGLSTSAGITAATSALVAAHEIGHNFGAPHDAESGSACEATPDGYLMAPRTNGSSTFSGCSLARMATVIDNATTLFPACLVSLSDYDVAVSAPAEVRVAPGESASLTLTVDNLGSEDAASVSLGLVTPAALAMTGATHGQGFCDYGPNELVCDLPVLAAGASWEVVATFAPAPAGRYPVSASVTAGTDRNADNDSVAAEVVVREPGSGGGGGGGGGGALGFAAAAALAVAAIRGRRA